MPDLGIIEAIRQAQEWCPICNGSGIASIGPEGTAHDCDNLDAHRELDAVMRHLENATDPIRGNSDV